MDFRNGFCVCVVSKCSNKMFQSSFRELWIAPCFFAGERRGQSDTGLKTYWSLEMGCEAGKSLFGSMCHLCVHSDMGGIS
jgi:hypothetical protein